MASPLRAVSRRQQEPQPLMQCQCSDRGNVAERVVPFTHIPRPLPAITTARELGPVFEDVLRRSTLENDCPPRQLSPMGIDFHLISNFGALALITLAGPAVIFILYYRRGAL